MYLEHWIPRHWDDWASRCVHPVAVDGFAAWGIGHVARATTDDPTPTVDLGSGPAIAETNPSTDREVEADEFDNVEKGPGEQAVLIDERTKTSYFTIEVTGSELVSECEPRVGTETLHPTRNVFLVLDVSASLARSVVEKAGGRMTCTCRWSPRRSR